MTNLFLFFCFFAHLGGEGSRHPAVVALAVVLERQKQKSLNFFGSRLLFFGAFLACPRARLFSLRFGQNFRVWHGNVIGALHQDPFLLLEDPCHAFRPKLLRACLQLRVFFDILRGVTKESPNAWLYGCTLSPESSQTMLLESLLVSWCDYARACIVKSVAPVSEKTCRCQIF